MWLSRAQKKQADRYRLVAVEATIKSRLRAGTLTRSDYRTFQTIVWELKARENG